jgi:membrane-associated protease RseP (regulator of RpoE activity)
LGDSLLFGALVRLVLGVDPTETTILLHPVALAGWFGLLVTCLNLLPVGQLDGGHVSYAVFGRHHTWISRGVLAALIVMGIGGWPGWLLWAFMLVALGLHHPPTWDPVTPLDRRRVAAAGLTLLIFILTFMPEPLSISEPLQVPIYEEDSVPVAAPAPSARGFVIPL